MAATIERLDITDQVYAVIKRRLLQHRLPAGTRLHIGRLAADLGVSPTPVKAALGRLAAERLVEFRPRGGAHVTQLSIRDVQELFEVRELLEQHAAARALATLADAECDRLADLAESLRRRLDDDGQIVDYDGFMADDTAFHLALVGLAGNRQLVHHYEALHVHTVVARAYYMRTGDETAIPARTAGGHVYREHLAIVAALRRRDPAAVRAAISRHLGVVRRFVDDATRDAAPPVAAGPRIPERVTP